VYEPIGYYVDSDTAYCADCYTDDDFYGFEGWTEPIAIPSHSEADSPTHCARCESLIPEVMTDAGIRYVADSVLPAIQASLEGREVDGRPCILKQWWEEYLEDAVSDVVSRWPDSDRYSPEGAR
jgi:hypothetical protein